MSAVRSATAGVPGDIFFMSYHDDGVALARQFIKKSHYFSAGF